MLNLLFLCTGNSCRSIMAEALLRHYGSSKFNSYSAGSNPTGEIHPLSLETLKNQNISNHNLTSKSWDELAEEEINIVITVCDNAHGESCPIFLSKAIKTHWSIADPAKFSGTLEEKKQEFIKTYNILETKIKKLAKINIKDFTKIQEELNNIS